MIKTTVTITAVELVQPIKWVHIMPLVINRLCGRHTQAHTDTDTHTHKHTHTQTDTDVRTETILRNKAPGLKIVKNWQNQPLSTCQVSCTKAINR